MAMKKKMTAYGFTAFLVFAVILAVADTAAAQGGAVNVKVEETKRNPPSGVLAPETGVVTIDLKVTVTIPPASGCTTLINLAYKVTVPGTWATAIPQPGSDSFVYEGEAGGTPTGVPVTGAQSKEVARDLKLTITTTREAPAFEAALYKVTATATVGGTQTCGITGGSGSQDITVKNGFFPLIETIPIQTLLKAGQNSQVRFPVSVTNFGNGETRVSAEAVYNSKNQLDALVPPAPFVLESKARQGQAAKNTKEVYITARTPHSNGYTNDVYAFQVDFKGSFAGAAGSEQVAEDKQTIFLSLQVQGVYAPGVDPAMFIGALGVAMLGVRRFLA